jgi:hypothetical protein
MMFSAAAVGLLIITAPSATSASLRMPEPLCLIQQQPQGERKEIALQQAVDRHL